MLIRARTLLGLGTPDYLHNIKDQEMIRLLYRDHIDWKHSKRDRLRKELEDKKGVEQKVARQMVEDKKQLLVRTVSSPLAEMTVSHLIEAGWTFQKNALAWAWLFFP